jgi:hypothetical protein
MAYYVIFIFLCDTSLGACHISSTVNITVLAEQIQTLIYLHTEHSCSVKAPQFCKMDSSEILNYKLNTLYCCCHAKPLHFQQMNWWFGYISCSDWLKKIFPLLDFQSTINQKQTYLICLKSFNIWEYSYISICVFLLLMSVATWSTAWTFLFVGWLFLWFVLFGVVARDYHLTNAQYLLLLPITQLLPPKKPAYCINKAMHGFHDEMIGNFDI